jgi:hypothetical protein
MFSGFFRNSLSRFEEWILSMQECLGKKEGRKRRNRDECFLVYEKFSLEFVG